MTEQPPEIIVYGPKESSTKVRVQATAFDRVKLFVSTDFGCALGVLGTADLVELANQILAAYGPK